MISLFHDLYFSQMYVPGKISKPEQPLIDIGTGYYAENVSADILKIRLELKLKRLIV